MDRFHPDLARSALYIPRFSFGPRLARLAKWLDRRRRAPRPDAADGVTIRNVLIPGDAGSAGIRVRIYSPKRAQGPVPAILWLHGGGFLFGAPEQDERGSIAMAWELGIVVAAVDYRLAPEHPFPAALEDCYAALLWLHIEAEALGIAPERIAVGGASAGGGLAAGLVLLAHDRQQVAVAFQLLIYPMLDDRTALRSDFDGSMFRLWTNRSNHFGWSAYLQTAPGSDGISHYAAPARRKDLRDLPPAWVGVGACDLFCDEDRIYAQRLTDAGVRCDLEIVEGAYHGFDMICPQAGVVQEFRRNYLDALRRGLIRPRNDGGVLPASISGTPLPAD